MKFRFVMQGRSAPRNLIYDNATSHLAWEDSGQRVSLAGVGLEYRDRAFPLPTITSPECPAPKSHAPRTLKIQLGLKCNFSCNYCNQASQPNESQGEIEDIDKFMASLDDWLKSPPDRIEFWGGEPLAYWKILKPLAERLREKFPSANMGMVTNGSLLDDAKVDWLHEMLFSISISHDGPAHKQNRGPDPLDNPEVIRRALVKLRPRIGFNCVLTKDHCSLAAVRKYIADALDVDEHVITLNTEELLLPYDLKGMASSPYTREEHQRVYDTVFSEIASRKSTDVVQVRQKIDDFFRSVASARPAMANGQKCGMDQPNALAVDLKGNAITCQNTSSDTDHLMGNVASFERIRLRKARHFSTRPKCLDCPVVQLCKGACMFLEDELWDAACDNSYTYNSAVLAGALYILTGAVLSGVEPCPIQSSS